MSLCASHRQVNSTQLDEAEFYKGRIKWTDYPASGTAEFPYAATGPIQYAQRFFYSFNNTHNATLVASCTSVWGEPTRALVSCELSFCFFRTLVSMYVHIDSMFCCVFTITVSNNLNLVLLRFWFNFFVNVSACNNFTSLLFMLFSFLRKSDIAEFGG